MYRKVEKKILGSEPGFSRTVFDYSKWCDTLEEAESAKISRGCLGLYERIKEIFIYLENSDETTKKS